MQSRKTSAVHMLPVGDRCLMSWGTAEQGQLLPALLGTPNIDQEKLEKLKIAFNCTFKGPSSHLKFIPLHPPLLDACAGQNHVLMTGQGNTEEYCQHLWSGVVSEQCVPGSASRSLNAVSKKCSNSKKIYVTKTPPKTAIKNRGSGPVSQPKETLLQTFIIQKPRHT